MNRLLEQIKSPEIEPHKHRQLTFGKRTKAIQWRKDSLFSECSFTCKKINLDLTQVRPLGGEDSLEKGMATYSSILAWRIPWSEEPGRLQSMGSQRVADN